MLTLTKQEKLIIYFLVGTFALGVGLKHYKARQITKAEGSRLDQIIAEEEAPVDINTDGFKDLIKLPGIGPSLAERIIEYRQVNGKFSSVEELKKVKGIGDKKLEKLKKHVMVEQCL